MHKTLVLALSLISGLLSRDLIATTECPNIIFLLTDDQTIGAVGCYGNEDVITPNLDQLASEGVRFLNHNDTTSICMASRASVMTGLYEYRHGCNFGHGPMKRRFFYGAWAQDIPKSAKQSGKPFCMSISLKAPHMPFTPDPIDLKLYESRAEEWYFRCLELTNQMKRKGQP